jgi:hypothetical protein
LQDGLFTSQPPVSLHLSSPLNGKFLTSFMTSWYTLWPFASFYGNLV